MPKPTIILNLLTTHLEYDFLEFFFTTDKIKIEEAIGLQLPEGMDKNKGIVINGRGPIWLYLILYRKIKESNAAKWIAQFDPQLGGAAKIESNDPLDNTIDKAAFKVYYPLPAENITVAFIGPPQSGKTVFLYALFKQLLKQDPIYTNKNIFIVKACPDGEGIWASELPLNVVKELRYKNAFSPEFVEDVLVQIKNTKKSKSVIFVDCGGKADEYNRQILAQCTHAIIVSANNDETKRWQQVYPETQILAIIDSYLSKNDPGKKNGIALQTDGMFYIDMIDLDRDNKEVMIPDEFVQFFLKAAETT